MKLLIGLTVAVLATTSLLAAPATAPLDFTLSTPSKIPGATLDPGSYTIRVVNQLSDRVILRVDGKNNPFHSIFIGIPNKEIKRPAAAGPFDGPLRPATLAISRAGTFPAHRPSSNSSIPKPMRLLLLPQTHRRSLQ
jgi:hypothetical protein